MITNPNSIFDDMLNQSDIDNVQSQVALAEETALRLKSRDEYPAHPHHAFTRGHSHNARYTDLIAWSPARRGAFLVMISLATTGALSHAQDLEPRAYVNTPVGLNFLIAAYGYTNGNVVIDPSLPLKNVQVETHGMFLAYVRSLDVWGKSGKFQLVLPSAWADGTGDVIGQPRERQVLGLADPKVRFSVNFYGAPALSLQQFKDYKQDLIIGGSVDVSVPLGQYDATKLLNLSTNRWSFRPGLGVSKAFGPLTLDLAGAVSFYTDNEDFLGGHTRAQDSIYSLEGHVSYTFQTGIWVALDGTYYTGGRTTIDGVKGNDRRENTRLGLTIALPVNQRNSIKLYASTAVSTSAGHSFDAIGIAWQYRWGAGL